MLHLSQNGTRGKGMYGKKIRCARCEGPHEYGKCENAVTVEENAVQHMGGVVVQRKTREAQRIKMSILNALKRVRKVDSKDVRNEKR